MNENFYERISEKLKAMSHAKRLEIVKILLENGECSITMLQRSLQVPQSTLSQHIARLQAAGIIRRRRQGTEVYCSLADAGIAELIRTVCQSEMAFEEQVQ